MESSEQPPPPPPPFTSPPAENSSAPVSGEVRTWVVLCHAAALLGVFFHFMGHLLGPLIVWLAKRGDSPEIDAHGKESLNFQLTWLIYDIVAGILCIVLIGIPILILLWLANIVLVIIASLRASEGTLYRYPLTIRFLH